MDVFRLQPLGVSGLEFIRAEKDLIRFGFSRWVDSSNGSSKPRRDQSGYTDAMMGSIYITLGILLLMAVRNPSEHRSLIAFAAWSSFAHAAVMAAMVFRDPRAREHLLGVAIFVAIGIPLMLLTPAEQPVEPLSRPATQT